MFSRADIFKNLIVSRLVKNFPLFHKTMNIQCGVHNSLPFVPIMAQINPGHALQSYFLLIHCNITSHLQRGFPSGFPSLRFSHQNTLCIRLLPICATCPARPGSSCYYLQNAICYTVKLHCLSFCSSSPLRYRYLLQNPVLKQLQLIFLLEAGNKVLHPHRSYTKLIQ